MCPTQLEEAPRKLRSTLERAGEMPSPLKGNTHSFGKVEEPGKGEEKMDNWGEKTQILSPTLDPMLLLFTSTGRYLRGAVIPSINPE